MIAAFAERYVDIQYTFVQFLTEHLSDCARACDRDLDQVLILAIIGQSHLSALLAHRGERMDEVSYGISALRVADVAGLPRETVRRKLARLAARGWIEQGTMGWRLRSVGEGDSQARRDLWDVDRRNLERMARLYADFSRILSAPPRIPLPPLFTGHDTADKPS